MHKTLTETTNVRRAFALLGTAMIALLLFLLNGHAVKAADGLELYTECSGVNTKAGESLTFNLYAVNGAQQESDVTLSIDSLPDGFSGFFKKGSYEVNRVHVSRGSGDAIATFQVTVPREAEEGTHTIVLKAVSDSGQEATLSIDLNVSELESGESNFTVEYPEQEGVSGTAFSYTTTIANNTLTDQTYNFSYDAPAGWQVSFKSGSDSTQISSIDVESGSSAGITISVMPSEKVEAGEYEIKCSATSAKESMETTLKVKILGTYDIELTTTDGRLSLDANANKESEVTLRITNSGNIDLENVSLSSTAPEDWDVSFEESSIELLEAGGSRDIKAYITPSRDALTGDYIAYITAGTSDQSATAQFRVTVKTQTAWGIFAVLIIAAVLAGLWYVMKKYGRR